MRADGIRPYKKKKASPRLGRLLCVLTLAEQSNIELHTLVDGLHTDALIVAVDGAAFLLGQVHGGETVDLVADPAVVTGIAALDHQIGRGDAAIPGSADRGGHFTVAVAVRLADAAVSGEGGGTGEEVKFKVFL